MKRGIVFLALSAGLVGCALAQTALLKLSSGPFTKQVIKNSAVIVWYTTEKSSSTVLWGKSESYGMKTEGSFASTHKVTLTNLSGGTTYHYRVVSKNEAEEVRSEDQSFTTPAADLSVRAANFPASLTVGANYVVRVSTYLGAQPLDKPYFINIYRAAWSAEGVLLKQDVLVGSLKVWPHNPNSYRTVDVPINIPVLKTGHRGLQEAFARRNVFTVKAEADEPEENVSNNQLTREVPVTH
ncbi:fibronectin type III domain-containing protein [Candidatus Saganbacteria bacterium]|nr:fibronectin type III domain-containing protein [Candidatus Saganbacteria bacterium]